MASSDELKKRNARIAERFRTPAAPRIAEAVRLRAALLARDYKPRTIARAVADRMQLDIKTVRNYFAAHAREQAKQKKD